MQLRRLRFNWDPLSMFGLLAIFFGVCVVGNRWVTKIDAFEVAACNAFHGHGWHLRLTDPTGVIHYFRDGDLLPYVPSADAQTLCARLPTGTTVSKERWTLDHRIAGQLQGWRDIKEGPLTMAAGAILVLVGRMMWRRAVKEHPRRSRRPGAD